LILLSEYITIRADTLKENTMNKVFRDKILLLKKEYEHLRRGKESLLTMIDEVEIAEAVYNSNAIENSTLSLDETEKILLEQKVSRNISLREVYEAKNLGRVVEYIRKKAQDREVDAELIILLHEMLLGGISDDYAGRFRKEGEYVRVGKHIAPAPELVHSLMETILENYLYDTFPFFLDDIVRFHLEFEHIHPFCDGNGRIGRVLINYQLIRHGYPMVIIRNSEKKGYYKTFDRYKYDKNQKPMERILGFAVIESLHKRVTYLKGEEIERLSDFIKQHNLSPSAMTNAAKFQRIPAFRERGVWKIGKGFIAVNE
jgi:Fic family protein